MHIKSTYSPQSPANAAAVIAQTRRDVSKARHGTFPPHSYDNEETRQNLSIRRLISESKSKLFCMVTT